MKNMDLKSVFKDVGIICYLVKKLQGVSPQVGKTVIQKLMYILERKGVGKYNYTLYHYGPYSSKVESLLNYAEFLKGVNVEWGVGRGYLIKPSVNVEHLEKSVSEDKKETINDIVTKVGSLTAKDLSLLSTILYVENQENISNDEELINVVRSIKPLFSKEEVKGKIDLIKKYTL
ncbi:MAG: hypothetical protein J7L34_05815 [Thermotogaceae bacterium]|nr:hypothetical protein [Thermotogaceae bacterium]